MDRQRDYSHVEEIVERATEKAVQRVIEAHQSACVFTSEDRELIKDMAGGAKLAKSYSIRAIVFAVLIAAGAMVTWMVAKAAGLSAFLPRG